MSCWYVSPITPLFHVTNGAIFMVTQHKALPEERSEWHGDSRLAAVSIRVFGHPGTNWSGIIAPGDTFKTFTAACEYLRLRMHEDLTAKMRQVTEANKALEESIRMLDDLGAYRSHFETYGCLPGETHEAR